MAAPKGNKNAVGHGRPPAPGFEDENVIKLGEELLDWMRACDADKKCDVVHLSEFYSEIKGIAPSQWDSLTHRSCFHCYYERAKKWMGKRIMKNKNLSPTYGSRFLGIYCKEVTEHEFEVAKKKIDYELERKAAMDSQKGMSPNDEKLDELIADVKSLKTKS